MRLPDSRCDVTDFDIHAIDSVCRVCWAEPSLSTLDKITGGTPGKISQHLTVDSTFVPGSLLAHCFQFGDIPVYKCSLSRNFPNSLAQRMRTVSSCET